MTTWLLSACTTPEDERPDNLIDKNRMADILTEVHMAEARVSRLSLGSIDSSNIAYKHLETQIFRKFGVDTAAYRKSYIFYSSHPAEMEAIYKQVVGKLTNKTSAARSNHS
ncbi:DUF4296 domain-containing protein [Spirosoma sp. KNUC1025]|uniref:DUF4296 domain-containing protein n=1 Tax=Spirosoma sp. KNUC1025 TaxID=2894082 RepID=UPI003868D3F4|nr:DUF4296 domain-containing protein [Spirosoma sp. KNUC1025]